MTVQQYCSNCWQDIGETDARFCPHCGVDLEAWGASRAAVEETINALPLGQETLRLGRAADNDIRLDHPAVSAWHARLEWRAAVGNWYVVDQQSAKGTFVNYQRVAPGGEGRPIEPEGDILWIAPYAFRLSTDADPQAPIEPAHLRLDVADLRREVKHPSSGRKINILDLEEMPLSFRPGEFIALVGGSGAGKSTLMKALQGLAPAQDGTVYVSGRPFIDAGDVRPFAAMHSIVGYVPQDDVVHRALTPLEALDFVSRLRLDPALTEDERADLIAETMEQVDLWPHRHKLIRNLSGGQRKRVNIALELLAKPRLLFLDEPTSGLDPGLDLTMMEFLKRWAADPHDPRTIVIVTHATENITACKYVAFMAPGGHVVYFGPPAQALAHFGVERFAEIYRSLGQAGGPAAGRDGQETAPEEYDPMAAHVARFKDSRDYFQFVQARRLRPASEADGAGMVDPPDPGRGNVFGGTGREQFRRQLFLLVRRTWKLFRRDRMNFIFQLLLGFLVAGLLWGVADADTFQVRGAESAQTVLFIMACAATWLGILNGTKEIVREQDIFERERRYGLNAPAYVASKLFVLSGVGAFQMTTMLLVASLPITFPAAGVFGGWLPVWLEWFITLQLSLTAGLAVGLLVSAATRTVDAATAIMFVLLLIQVMFAGLFFEDAAWSDLLSFFTFSRWGLEGLATSADLNGLLGRALGSGYRADPAYTFTPVHLLSRWAVLAGYIALLYGLTTWIQSRKR